MAEQPFATAFFMGCDAIGLAGPGVGSADTLTIADFVKDGEVVCRSCNGCHAGLAAESREIFQWPTLFEQNRIP